MARYMITYWTATTGQNVMHHMAETPEDALRGGREAQKEGFRDIRIIDNTSGAWFDITRFAAEHRLS